MNNSSDTLIRFDGVSKTFVTRTGEQVRAISDLNLQVHRGEMVAIVGQTGCGKSTAFNLLLGLYAATSGNVSVEGFNPHDDFEALKGKIAVIFQDGRLLPWRTARDNVALGLEYMGVGKSERNAAAERWLDRLGLAGRENAYPYELSGGMRQRVGIARCFSLNPDIILADESFSALDELTADRLRSEFVSIVKDENKTGVFITHSIEEALTIGDRVAVFRAPGHVAAEFDVSGELTEAQLSEMRREVRRVMAEGLAPRSNQEDVA